MVIVVLAMFLVLAMAALAIDVAQWYQKHHQAQVSADSAALAAANCLANSKCTAGTATGTATSMASTNQVPASGVAVTSTDSNGGNVTVTTATTAPQQFYVGQTVTVSARAVASYTVHLTAPASIFGADCIGTSISQFIPPTTCTPNCSQPGVTINSGGNTSITGAIVTNGSLSISTNGGVTLGALEYGSTCTATQNSISLSHNTTVGAGPGSSSGFNSYPETFNNVWTGQSSNLCSDSSVYKSASFPGSANITVTGSGTYPSEVDFTGNNQSFGSSTTPAIVCAQTIKLAGNSQTLTNITLVANSFTFPSTNGNVLTISPATTATSDQGTGPNVSIYDTSLTPLNFGSNNLSTTGVVYAPGATIIMGGNNYSPDLIEGNQVQISGNNTAGGPTQILTGFPGIDSLTQ
ncbi:MAG TPA: pilus assembly protein TadG-related protein [Solirubrobacteraceae bacterium]|nr:pilus assembly protein TadG-related protein [Solirubrobacteraceae bacterium]